MPRPNLQIRLQNRPVGLPDADTFSIDAGQAAAPAEGEVLVKVAYVSLDPAMRGWIDERPSYIPPVGIGEVMRALGVGEVVASSHADFTTGDRVSGPLGWQELACVDGKELHHLPPGVPFTLALGPLGMIGMTAYFGLFDVGTPKPDDTVLVSGAAGAVGSLVGQLAKIHGCRVVGIAGNDDKCTWLTDELGFDAAINYRTEEMYPAIKEACPRGIDVFFDNVGGEILNTGLTRINRGARVIICGAISQYNATEPVPGPSNYLSLLVNRARMEGFIVFDYAHRYGEAAKAIGEWLQAGKIHYREDIVDGLRNAPDALLRLFDGSNTGKLMVRIDAEA